MAQTLAINTDVNVGRTAVSASLSGSADTDNSTFSSELDRQLKSSDTIKNDQNEGGEKISSQSDAEQKAEKTDTDDGKILPDEVESDDQAIMADGEASEQPALELLPDDEAEGDTDSAEKEDAETVTLAAAVSTDESSHNDRKRNNAVTRGQPSDPRNNDAALRQATTPSLATSKAVAESETQAKSAIRADILQAIQEPTARNKTFAGNRLANADTSTTARQLASLSAGTNTAPARTDGSVMPLLTPVGASATTTASSASAPSLDVQPNLNNPAWAKVMSSRVVWMAKQGIHQAELRMNPANLGPVEVRLTVQNEQASVTFLAANATTREALEQSMPRLRESLSENGLQLTDAEVNDQASDESQNDKNENHQVTSETQVGVVTDDNTEQDELPGMMIDGLTTGVSLYA